MMLPSLISVSLTPVSYFFCATAGIETAAMINPESPSERPSEKPSVLMKSLAQRFMSFLFGCGPGVTAAVGQFPRGFCSGTKRTIAGVLVARKRRGVERAAITRGDL